MGIRYLNSFLKKHCRSAIHRIHMRELEGKRIVIDASIYMYRFEADGELVTEMRKFVTALQGYGIHPMFVFDGKPPQEKTNTIIHRREQRDLAATEHIELTEKLQSTDLTVVDRRQLVDRCDVARRTAAKITREKELAVKRMFDTRNVDYCVAPSEADVMCATMVLRNRFWGCMSDDMDMFVYGCGHIIRDLDMDTHMVSLYVLDDILEKMHIGHEDFKRVCIMSGTDYDMHVNDVVTTKDERLTFYVVVNMYYRFRNTVKFKNMTFYKWITHYLKMDIDHDALEKIYSMYSPCVLDPMKVAPALNAHALNAHALNAHALNAHAHVFVPPVLNPHALNAHAHVFVPPAPALNPPAMNPQAHAFVPRV